MERLVIFTIGAIIILIGIYLIIFNIPVEGNFTDEYGGWGNSNVSGLPLLFIGGLIISIPFSMKSDKNKK